MRTTLTLLLGACASMGNAQLVNGSFEEGLNGWTYDAWDNWSEQEWSVTADTPEGGADSALSIPATGSFSASFNRAYQVLENVEPGSTYRIGGWAKAHFSPGLNPVSIFLCRSNGAFECIPYSPAITFTLQGPWQFKDTLVTVDPPPLPGESVRFVLSGGESWYPVGFSEALFDNLSMQLELSTSVPGNSGMDAPSYRPNPATDKLWVHLPETPLSILAIDASGRTHDLKNFKHRDQTVEVDLDALPPGICLLRLTTASGAHVVRFVKA